VVYSSVLEFSHKCILSCIFKQRNKNSKAQRELRGGCITGRIKTAFCTQPSHNWRNQSETTKFTLWIRKLIHKTYPVFLEFPLKSRINDENCDCKVLYCHGSIKLLGHVLLFWFLAQTDHVSFCTECSRVLREISRTYRTSSVRKCSVYFRGANGTHYREGDSFRSL